MSLIAKSTRGLIPSALITRTSLAIVLCSSMSGCESTPSAERDPAPLEPERTLPEAIVGHKNPILADMDMATDMPPDMPEVYQPPAPINPRSIAFEDACAPGERITIAAVGDVLLHSRLQRQATKRDKRFGSLWFPVSDLIEGADIAYANLEGPTAKGVLEGGELAEDDPGFRFDGEVYSTWPRFNYHPLLVEDLEDAGFDVVSTANNHTLDRAGIGVDRTIDALERAELAYTGTRRSTWKKRGVPKRWHTITEHDGWKIAWLACTYSTNGLPDYHEQVLFCYDDRAAVIGTVEQLAKDPSLDAIIVTPHWGWEYREEPRGKQRKLGRELIEAGATAVIGGHVHVLQPWEKHDTEDGREGFILYSTGNFVSNMAELAERTSIMLMLGLTREKPGARAKINGVRYIPLWLHRDGGDRYVGDIARSEAKIPAEANAHVHRIFGSYNMFDPDDLFGTTPQCDPEWTPPLEAHPHNGGVGGACNTSKDKPCATSSRLSEARCDASKTQGFCSLSCEGKCPYVRGAPRTMCASDEWDATAGACHVRCKKHEECRPGYVCQYRYQVGSDEKRRKVCVQAQSPQ